MLGGEIDDEQALKLLEGMDWDDRVVTEPEANFACEIEQEEEEEEEEEIEVQPHAESSEKKEDLTFEAVVAEINRVKGLSPEDLAREQRAREEQEHKEQQREKEKMRKHLDIRDRARRSEENEAPETSDPDVNPSSSGSGGGSGQGSRGLNSVLQLQELKRWTAESSSQSHSFTDEVALDEMISAERARVAAHVREVELKTLAQAQKQLQAHALSDKQAPKASAETREGQCQGQEQKQTPQPQQAALSGVTYRLAVPGDAEELSVFAKKTFTDTFFEPCGYSEEDLQAYLQKSYEPQHWLQHMQSGSDCLLVAVSMSTPPASAGTGQSESAPSPPRILGYILVSGPMDLPHEKLSAAGKARSGEVVKLYVCPSTFGAGVAAELMDRGLVWLLTHFPGDVYLSVWSQNYRAQGFYNKYGGQLAATYKYQVGETLDEEWIYLLPRVAIEAYFAARATGAPAATASTTATTTATVATSVAASAAGAGTGTDTGAGTGTGAGAGAGTAGGSVFGFHKSPMKPRASPAKPGKA